MMTMLRCRLVLGVLILNVVVASPPRYRRQLELDNYDVVDLENTDTEYYEELTTEEPEIEVGTVLKNEDNDPTPEASLEEEDEEEEDKESGDKKLFPVKPQLIPSSSGDPEVLMESDTQREKELRLEGIDTLHISGSPLGSGYMLSSEGSGSSGTSGTSGDITGSGVYHSGEPPSYGSSGDFSSRASAGLSSGTSGDIVSEISVDLGSEISVDLVSGESGDFVSGASGGIVSGASGGIVSGAFGDFVSGASGSIVSEASEDFVSGASGGIVSGAFGDFVSGASGSIVFEASEDFVSGASGGNVSGESGDFISGASGDFVSRGSENIVSGASGGIVSGASGDFVSGASGDIVSRTSEEFVSGASGEIVSGVSGEFDSGDFSSGASGNLVSGSSGDIISGASGDIISTSFVDLGSGQSGFHDEVITVIPDREEAFLLTTTISPEEAFGVSRESGEPVESGAPEESGTPVESGVTIIPDLFTEEDLFLTTQSPSKEGAGDTTESGEPDSDLDNDIEIDITGMPTCRLCTCLGGSVYCDELKLVDLPPLPKDTTHLYARYNKITKINKRDFTNLNKLKRIDLRSNAISKIEDDAFFGLPALEELVIRENHVAQLPALPATMILVDASHNRLGSTGIQNEAFKDMTHLLYLYLTDNNIDHIPLPLPESLRSLHLQNNNIQMIHADTFCKPKNMHYIRKELEDIRLDGNPVNLSRTPQAYVCLQRIPVGALI